MVHDCNVNYCDPVNYEPILFIIYSEIAQLIQQVHEHHNYVSVLMEVVEHKLAD